MGKKILEAKRESEVWEVINREKKRKGRKKVIEGIRMEEWKEPGLPDP